MYMLVVVVVASVDSLNALTGYTAGADGGSHVIEEVRGSGDR
jgi:hypothetical protein